MNEVLNTPFFGIVLTIVAYEIGVFFSCRFKLAICNPMLVAATLLIGFLLLTGIQIETYNIGGDYISLFLGPTTAVLAVPLYKQLNALKSNFIPILFGIFVGSLTSFVLVLLCAKFLGMDDILKYSLLPKSITIPMGIELSREIGGVPAISIAAIVISGISGGVAAPIICKICKIKHPVAQGVAIGTASHAVGTAKAVEMGEVQGAMSSLAIGVTGVVTTILTPLLLKFFTP